MSSSTESSGTIGASVSTGERLNWTRDPRSRRAGARLASQADSVADGPIRHQLLAHVVERAEAQEQELEAQHTQRLRREAMVQRIREIVWEEWTAVECPVGHRVRFAGPRQPRYRLRA